MRALRYLSTLLIVSTAGCVSGPLVTRQGDPEIQIADFYSHGVAGRDLKLRILGNPFAVPDDVLAHAIEADVQMPLAGRPMAHPVLDPQANARPNYALVFAFDPSPALIGDNLCQAPAAATASHQPTGSGMVKVVGAFCVSGRAETSAEGSGAAISPDDPRFRDLTREMMLALFRPDIHPNGGGHSVTNH
jgi:hypothetical protein